MSRKKYMIRHVGVKSLAKIEGVLAGTVGLISGIYYAIAGTTLFGTMGLPGLTSAIRVFAILLFPIIYAAVGFLAGATTATIYNFVAKHIGGIELDLQD